MLIPSTAAEFVYMKIFTFFDASLVINFQHFSIVSFTLC